MTVAVNNESDASPDETGLAQIAEFVLEQMGVSPAVELSVTLVDEPEMTRLHVQYMDEPGPTDVLAFPMDDLDEMSGEVGESQLLGDVILCPSVAAAQARDAGHDTDAELRLLCAHGVLHLLGYDHHEPEDEREMFGLQARLLADFSSVSGGAV
jgi:probable rRNA maturation factor